MSITHTEVRRHPRWREQVNASQSGPLPMSLGARLVALVAILIVATAIAVVILKS
jgi:hypothetical protein